MKFPHPDSRHEGLINELFVELAKMNIGRFEMRFYSGGRILVDLDAKPPKRRGVAPPRTTEDALASGEVPLGNNPAPEVKS